MSYRVYLAAALAVLTAACASAPAPIAAPPAKLELRGTLPVLPQ